MSADVVSAVTSMVASAKAMFRGEVQMETIEQAICQRYVKSILMSFDVSCSL